MPTTRDLVTEIGATRVDDTDRLCASARTEETGAGDSGGGDDVGVGDRARENGEFSGDRDEGTGDGGAEAVKEAAGRDEASMMGAEAVEDKLRERFLRGDGDTDLDGEMEALIADSACCAFSSARSDAIVSSACRCLDRRSSAVVETS